MQKFKGYEAKKSGSAKETLPAGGYVCQIQGARVEQYNNGFSSLVLAIDVVEGEYAGIWKKDFDNNPNEDKKWRGTFRISIPKDDGTESDNWTKRTFNNAMWAIEQSNPGFTWDWDERKLKGKKIGVLYRNKEWEFKDNTGWTTEAAGAESIDNIRNGKFKMLKDKPLKNKTPQVQKPTFTDVEDDGELPF